MSSELKRRTGDGRVPPSFQEQLEYRTAVKVHSTYAAGQQSVLAELKDRRARSGATLLEVDGSSWMGAYDIFVPIQAHEAAQLHRGLYDNFEPAIADRLRWGASLSPEEIERWRLKHQEFFCNCDGALWQQRLRPDAGHSGREARCVGRSLCRPAAHPPLHHACKSRRAAGGRAAGARREYAAHGQAR
jgi:hypothetical protein